MQTYLISLGQGEMLALSDGKDAADAVARYYDDIDAYCPPSDELSEEATVSALPVTDDLAAELGELLAECDEGTPEDVDALLATRGPVRWITLDVALSKGEWTVVERDPA